MSALLYLVLGIVAQATLQPNEDNDGSMHAMWLFANHTIECSYDDLCAALTALKEADLVEDISEGAAYQWRLTYVGPVAKDE